MSAWDEWNTEKLSDAARDALNDLSRPGAYDEGAFEAQFRRLIAELDPRQAEMLVRLIEEMEAVTPEGIMLGHALAETHVA